MKQLIGLCFVLISILCFSGCLVQSLNPFYTEDAVIESPVKSGSWKMIGKDGKPKMAHSWEFEKNRITVYDENGAVGILKVTYFNVENTTFLDATVEKADEKMCTWWLMNVTPVHTVCRVAITEEALLLAPIDFECISKAVEDKTFDLPYILKKDWDAFLITASSQELMAFLKKNRKDNNLFSETHTMKFIIKNIP